MFIVLQHANKARPAVIHPGQVLRIESTKKSNQINHNIIT